jgi:acyl-CoA synthetase (NDP forming)
VGILTNAGGAGILAADACETEGLVVATLDAATIATLKAFLPDAASTGNPVDMLASASPADYGRAITAMLADAGLDSLIVAYVPPALSDPAEIAAAIRDTVAEAKSSKPVIVSFVTSDAAPPSVGRLPTFVFPERAATALARMTSYAEWRRRPASEVDPAPPAPRDRLSALMAPALERGGGWLSPREVDQLLRDMGLSPLRGLLCRTASEAVQAATTLGYPVALKADGPDILHKSDVGGVVLNLPDVSRVRAAFAGLVRTLGTAMTGVLVQEMAPEAPEFLVGATVDPLFGPVIALGAGGTLAELVRDVAFRVAPLAPRDVVDMASEIRAARLLRGFRGARARDERALLAVVTAVSRLVTACPEIVELDLNPVRVYASGALVLDARVRVAPVVARPSTRLEY